MPGPDRLHETTRSRLNHLAPWILIGAGIAAIVLVSMW